jgi:chaperonin GroES
MAQPIVYKLILGASINMKLRPLHDRIIVKRLEEERKSAGGIVIPDTAAEKPSIGEVIAVGPGKTDDNGKLIPMGVKTGDKILFGKYSGQEFKMEGQDFLHMREDDVIGIVA